MTVVRTIDRIRDGLEAVFTTRSAPDDEIEFDASLGVVQVHADEEDEDGSCYSQTVVYVWLAMATPEVSPKSRATCQVIVPMHHLDDAEEVARVGNDLWEALQSHRTLTALGLGTDDEESP